MEAAADGGDRPRDHDGEEDEEAVPSTPVVRGPLPTDYLWMTGG
jgi:hypothetical protein